MLTWQFWWWRFMGRAIEGSSPGYHCGTFPLKYLFLLFYLSFFSCESKATISLNVFSCNFTYAHTSISEFLLTILLTHFSPVLHFEWLVSMWNAALGWNRLSAHSALLIIFITRKRLKISCSANSVLVSRNSKLIKIYSEWEQAAGPTKNTNVWKYLRKVVKIKNARNIVCYLNQGPQD